MTVSVKVAEQLGESRLTRLLGQRRSVGCPQRCARGRRRDGLMSKLKELVFLANPKGPGTRQHADR